MVALTALVAIAPALGCSNSGKEQGDPSANGGATATGGTSSTRGGTSSMRGGTSGKGGGTSDACQGRTACESGDGCCPDGCTVENDKDCVCAYAMDISTPTAVFRSTFESGTIDPDVSVGTSPALVDGRSGGEMVAVQNPAPDVCNPSRYVLQATVPSGYVRAEYQSPRFPTVDHGYIYTWREYIPVDFFDDMTLDWMVRAQWKTWPCGTEQPIDVADQICDGGGIFNDFTNGAHLASFNFRTIPDCNEVHVPTPLGAWSTYVVEVYWTQANDGYYRVFRNGQLLADERNVKTLYDGFVEGECDMVLAGGLYTTWESDERALLTAYFDDYAIFDMNAGVELSDVCPTCAAQTEIAATACSFDGTLPVVDGALVISSFDDPCDWSVGELSSEEAVAGDASLRWAHELTTRMEMTFPSGSTLDFSNAASSADSLSFWVHNNVEEPGNSMVLLMYAENDSTDGPDYYMVRVAFDFTGWQQIVVPRNEIAVSRTPLGWDQIDNVMFATDGWDCEPNPDRVVHLDDLKFTATP